MWQGFGGGLRGVLAGAQGATRVGFDYEANVGAALKACHRVVDTLAELRALTNPGYAMPVLVTANGDAEASGAQTYICAPNDTVTNENIGRAIVGTDGTRWIAAPESPNVIDNLKRFGVKWDGTDDAAKLSTVAQYLASIGGGYIRLPGGNGGISSLSLPPYVGLLGPGSGACSITALADAVTLTLPVAHAGYMEYGGFSLAGNTGDANQTGILFQPSGTGVTNNGTIFKDLKITACGKIGMDFQGDVAAGPLIQYMLAERIFIANCEAQGMRIQGEVIDSTFIQTEVVQNAQGNFSLPNCEFSRAASAKGPDRIQWIGGGMNAPGAAQGTMQDALLLNGISHFEMLGGDIENAGVQVGSSAGHVQFHNTNLGTTVNLDYFFKLNGVNSFKLQGVSGAASGGAVVTKGVDADSTATANIKWIDIDESTVLQATTPYAINRVLGLASGWAYRYRNHLRIDSEAAAAADTLTNIGDATGTANSTAQRKDGELTVLQMHNPAHVITVQNGAGIELSGLVDFTFPDTNTRLVLRYDAERGIDVEIARHYGATPGYTPSNVTPTRALDASTATAADVANVLGTLIEDLQSRGGI